MNYEVTQDKLEKGAWRVEAINREGDGEVYVAVFYGPDAELRARQYASLMNIGVFAKAS